MIEPAPSQNERGRDRENGSKRRPRFRAWRVGAILLFSGGMGAYAHRDYVRSAAIFMRRAEQGQAIAQTYLGYMYEKGRGVPQDFVLAATWLRRAANQGYPDAQFLLGLLYDKGHGVNQDFLEAEIWLNLAAAKAEPRQRDYWTQIRDALAGKLTLDERAEAQRRASEWAPIQER
jgi:uncharacterized protein